MIIKQFKEYLYNTIIGLLIFITMNKRFCCTNCDYKSTREYNLNRHILTKHDEKKVVENEITLEIQPFNYNNLKNVGWLYCITSGETNIYKCGYTAQLSRKNCESYLRSRYGIIVTNPEIVHLVKVSEAKIAEKALFLQLKNYKHIRELYRVDDINIIISTMNEIASNFSINKQLIKEIDMYYAHLAIKNTKLKNVTANICNNCGKEFSRGYNIKVHLETCRGVTNSLECQYCNKIFTFRSSKSIHQKKCKAKETQIAITNNNNTTNNIVNFMVYTPHETLTFNDNHIDKNKLEQLLTSCRNKTNRVLLEYARTIMEKTENICIRKKHITNGYSEVHEGDNNWTVASDREVYDKLTNDIALQILNKLNYLELNSLLTTDKLKYEIAELTSERHEIQKQYLPLFNTSRLQLVALICNITRKHYKHYSKLI